MDKKYKVLIVDDNPKNIQLIGNILQNTDFSIGFATNGEQALKILQNSYNYDIVLLDMKMPVMDGIETCNKMRKDEMLKDIPVIFLTAHNETDELIKGFEAGAQDYLSKPFNPKELLARLNNQLLIKEIKEQLNNNVQELNDSLISNFILLNKNIEKIRFQKF